MGEYGDGRVAACTSLATRRSLALGLGRYNRGPRAVRGGYAYAAHYARVIPVIAPYLNPAARRMLAMTGSTKIGLILWREAGCAVRDRNLQQHQSKQQVKPMRRVS